jgi:zinc protease
MNHSHAHPITVPLFVPLFAVVIMTLASAGARAQAPDRTVLPKAKPAPAVRLPEIQKSTLSNGLNIWLVQHSELPVVALNMVFKAGSDQDPSDLPGLASMTCDVLDEGTATRDALAISSELESIGANLGVGSSLDGSFVTLRSLTKHIDKALAVYADVIVNASFPQKEFDRLKGERLASLKQQSEQPPTIANNAYSRILYTGSHPYGMNSSGTPESVNNLTRENLVEFYKAQFIPNAATLIVVGDISMEAVKSKLEPLLAAWKPGELKIRPVPSTDAPASRTVYLVDKPKAAQSEVRIGYPALPRSTPDYFPVFVMNRMLGGQFTSRINLNLREKHGYTYGARSGFAFARSNGPFTASGPIVTEKTDSSLIEFFREIDAMAAEGMTPAELTQTKGGLIGAFALNFETPSQVAGQMQNQIIYGLPDDYLNTYLSKVDAVSLEDVKRVAKQYLDTSRMAVVVVGDLATIRAGIEALKLGPTVVCDRDGAPLP